jgi:hypothetical protein
MKLNVLVCLGLWLAPVAAHAQLNQMDSSLDQGKVIAHYLEIVSAGIVADVYQNGKIVPSNLCTMTGDIYGAQFERVKIEVHEGDWIVFHAVNNGLHDGFPPYFVVAGMIDKDHSAFQSGAQPGQWFVCDTLEAAPRFIAERDYQGDGMARKVVVHWGDGDKQIAKTVPDWNGDPLWGNSHDPWLKFVVPPRPMGED